MPPKVKLHKTKNARKAVSRVSQNGSSEASCSSVMLSPELELQFENETCWCLQQLNGELTHGKLNLKQIQEHKRAINTLIGNSAPMAKKRQIMRFFCGDYRAKMAAENEKTQQVTPLDPTRTMRVVQTSPTKKSIFVRKSTCSSTPDNSFKFNFPQKEEDDLSENLSNVTINSTDSKNLLQTSEVKPSFSLSPSNNSFRFNFNVSGNE